METVDEPRPLRYPMIWAVRAVPVLVVFAAVDLLQKNPPLSFLVITLVQLALGAATLVAIHKQRRDLVALAYVVVVFVTSLVHPVRSGQLLLLASLGLLAIGADQLWQRLRPEGPAQPGRPELGPDPS